MKRAIRDSVLFGILLVAASGCSRKSPVATTETSSAPMTTPATAQPAPSVAAVPALQGQLLGAWRMTHQYGESPSKKVAREKQRLLELKPDGGWQQTDPVRRSGKQEGTWALVDADGNHGTMKMTMKIGDEIVPADSRTVVLKDDGTLAMANALDPKINWTYERAK